METKPKETLIRPVKCHFCNEPMYYSGDPRHKPEIYVNIYVTPPGFNELPDFNFYCHVLCWNKKMCDLSKAAKDYQSTV